MWMRPGSGARHASAQRMRCHSTSLSIRMSGQSSSGPYRHAAAGSEERMALPRDLGFLVKRWSRKSKPSGSISFDFGNRDRLLAPSLLRLWRLQAQLNQFYSLLRTIRATVHFRSRRRSGRAHSPSRQRFAVASESEGPVRCWPTAVRGIRFK